MKRPTWRQFLAAFEKLPEKYLEYPVVIGGGDKLYDFHGFETLGIKKNYNIIYLAKDVLNILKTIPTEDLDKTLPNGEFFGDKFGVGVNRVCLGKIFWDHKGGFTNDYYAVLQDYFYDDENGNPVLDPTDEKVEESYKELIYNIAFDPDKTKHLDDTCLIRPKEVVVIEVLDGACILSDEDSII